MKEIWKDIAGYEGKYQVSNLGRIRSLDRIVYNQGRHYFQNGKILKAGSQKSGYLFVTLYKAGKRKEYLVHRLVAQAFIPNPNGLSQVNHKDEDVTNNKVENLEWCTAKYNCNYGTRNEKIAKKAGKKVIQLTLDWQAVHVWSSAHECARAGFNFGSVCACCRGERNMHKGYRWKYV